MIHSTINISSRRSHWMYLKILTGCGRRLLYNLSKYGIIGSVISLTKSFLKGRFRRVIANYQSSETLDHNQLGCSFLRPTHFPFHIKYYTSIFYEYICRCYNISTPSKFEITSYLSSDSFNKPMLETLTT